MLRHVVCFRWPPGTSQAAIDEFVRGLNELPGKIPSIRDYQFGPDAGLREGNYDFAVVADFDGPEGFIAYRDHPAHLAFLAEHVEAIGAQRVGVQFHAGAL
jgi:stress responsive alpha/beta barrel protein